MTNFVLIVAILILLPVFAAEVAARMIGNHRSGRILLAGILAAPALLLLCWLLGTWWIFASSECSDVDTCDSGGWLAMSAGIFVAALFGAFAGLVVTLLWRRFRAPR